MAITSDMERVEAAREALEQEEAERSAAQVFGPEWADNPYSVEAEKQRQQQEIAQYEAADPAAGEMLRQTPAIGAEEERVGAQPIEEVAPPRESRTPLYDPNLGHKTDEELVQGRSRILEMLDDPPTANRDPHQMQSFQDLLIRINSELESRGVQY